MAWPWMSTTLTAILLMTFVFPGNTNAEDEISLWTFYGGSLKEGIRDIVVEGLRINDLVVLRNGWDHVSYEDHKNTVESIKAGRDGTLGTDDDVTVLHLFQVGTDERSRVSADLYPGDLKGPCSFHDILEEIRCSDVGFASFYIDANPIDGIPDRTEEGAAIVNIQYEEWQDILIGEEAVNLRYPLTIFDALQTIGYDGLLLDSLDVYSPWSGMGWASSGLPSFIDRIRNDFPDKKVYMRGGEYFFVPHFRYHYSLDLASLLDGVVVEAYYLDSLLQGGLLPFHVSPFFWESKNFIAPKIQSSASLHRDGKSFNVLSLDYASSPASLQATFPNTFTESVFESRVYMGWPITQAPPDFGFVTTTDTNNALLAVLGQDISPPVWLNTRTGFTFFSLDAEERPWNSPGTIDFTESYAQAREGVLKVIPGPYQLTVRWDVAVDQSGPVMYNVYISATSPVPTSALDTVATDPENVVNIVASGSTALLKDVTPLAGSDLGGPRFYTGTDTTSAFEYTIPELNNGVVYYVVVRAEDRGAPEPWAEGPGGGYEDQNVIDVGAQPMNGLLEVAIHLDDLGFEDWNRLPWYTLTVPPDLWQHPMALDKFKMVDIDNDFYIHYRSNRIGLVGEPFSVFLYINSDDKTWTGDVDGADFRIRFNIASEEPINSVQEFNRPGNLSPETGRWEGVDVGVVQSITSFGDAIQDVEIRISKLAMQGLAACDGVVGFWFEKTDDPSDSFQESGVGQRMPWSDRAIHYRMQNCEEDTSPPKIDPNSIFVEDLKLNGTVRVSWVAAVDDSEPISYLAVGHNNTALMVDEFGFPEPLVCVNPIDCSAIILNNLPVGEEMEISLQVSDRFGNSASFAPQLVTATQDTNPPEWEGTRGLVKISRGSGNDVELFWNGAVEEEFPPALYNVYIYFGGETGDGEELKVIERTRPLLSEESNYRYTYTVDGDELPERELLSFRVRAVDAIGNEDKNLVNRQFFCEGCVSGHSLGCDSGKCVCTDSYLGEKCQLQWSTTSQLINPSFEDSRAGDNGVAEPNYWFHFTSGFTLDSGEDAFDGSAYLHMASSTRSEIFGAYQIVTFDADRLPLAFKVSAWSQALGVRGEKDQNYALAADAYFEDGSSVYGLYTAFNTGVHDWEQESLVISSAEGDIPIQSVWIYCIFRFKEGSVLFDGLTAEIPDVPSARVEELGNSVFTDVQLLRNQQLDDTIHPDTLTGFASFTQDVTGRSKATQLVVDVECSHLQSELRMRWHQAPVGDKYDLLAGPRDDDPLRFGVSIPPDVLKERPGTIYFRLSFALEEDGSGLTSPAEVQGSVTCRIRASLRADEELTESSHTLIGTLYPMSFHWFVIDAPIGGATLAVSGELPFLHVTSDRCGTGSDAECETLMAGRIITPRQLELSLGTYFITLSTSIASDYAIVISVQDATAKTVVVGDFMYGTLDDAPPNEDSIGCQGTDTLLPLPTGWTLALATEQSALVVVASYRFGTNCLVLGGRAFHYRSLLDCGFDELQQGDGFTFGVKSCDKRVLIKREATEEEKRFDNILSADLSHNVILNGFRFATLDNSAYVDATIGCQSTAKYVPQGWDVAEYDDTAQVLLMGRTSMFGSPCLTFKDGLSYYNPSALPTPQMGKQCGDNQIVSIVSSGNSLVPGALPEGVEAMQIAECNRKILIKQTVSSSRANTHHAPKVITNFIRVDDQLFATIDNAPTSDLSSCQDVGLPLPEGWSLATPNDVNSAAAEALKGQFSECLLLEDGSTLDVCWASALPNLMIRTSIAGAVATEVQNFTIATTSTPTTTTNSTTDTASSGNSTHTVFETTTTTILGGELSDWYFATTKCPARILITAFTSVVEVEEPAVDCVQLEEPDEADVVRFGGKKYWAPMVGDQFREADCSRQAIAPPDKWELAPATSASRSALVCLGADASCFVTGDGSAVHPTNGGLCGSDEDHLLESFSVVLGKQCFAVANCPQRLLLVKEFSLAEIEQSSFDGVEIGGSQEIEVWEPWATGYQLVGGGRTGKGISTTINNMGEEGGACQRVQMTVAEREGFTISAWSKAESVSGVKDVGYSIYVDLWYVDGTAQWGWQGQNAVWETGTHGWELATVTISLDPDKLTSHASVCLLFRGHTGTVWWDDVSVGGPEGLELVENPSYFGSDSGWVPHMGGYEAYFEDAPKDEETLVDDALEALQKQALLTAEELEEVRKKELERETATSMRTAATDGLFDTGAVLYVSELDNMVAPIYCSAQSRALNVGGLKDVHYALSVEMRYEDGTWSLGNFAPFNVGTHDWERVEMVLTPAKPVVHIQIVALFRGHTGTAYFDDINCQPSPCDGDVTAEAQVFGRGHISTFDHLVYTIHREGEFLLFQDDALECNVRFQRDLELSRFPFVVATAAACSIENQFEILVERQKAQFSKPVVYIGGALYGGDYFLFPSARGNGKFIMTESGSGESKEFHIVFDFPSLSHSVEIAVRWGPMIANYYLQISLTRPSDADLLAVSGEPVEGDIIIIEDDEGGDGGVDVGSPTDDASVDIDDATVDSSSVPVVDGSVDTESEGTTDEGEGDEVGNADAAVVDNSVAETEDETPSRRLSHADLNNNRPEEAERPSRFGQSGVMRYYVVRKGDDERAIAASAEWVTKLEACGQVDSLSKLSSARLFRRQMEVTDEVENVDGTPSDGGLVADESTDSEGEVNVDADGEIEGSNDVCGGLLGNCNGESDDDMIVRNSGSIEEWLSSVSKRRDVEEGETLLETTEGDDSGEIVVELEYEIDPSVVDRVLESWMVTSESSLFRYEQGQGPATELETPDIPEFLLMTEDEYVSAESLCVVMNVPNLSECIVDVVVAAGDEGFTEPYRDLQGQTQEVPVAQPPLGYEIVLKEDEDEVDPGWTLSTRDLLIILFAIIGGMISIVVVVMLQRFKKKKAAEKVEQLRQQTEGKVSGLPDFRHGPKGVPVEDEVVLPEELKADTNLIATLTKMKIKLADKALEDMKRKEEAETAQKEAEIKEKEEKAVEMVLNDLEIEELGDSQDYKFEFDPSVGAIRKVPANATKKRAMKAVTAFTKKGKNPSIPQNIPPAISQNVDGWLEETMAERVIRKSKSKKKPK